MNPQPHQPPATDYPVRVEDAAAKTNPGSVEAHYALHRYFPQLPIPGHARWYIAEGSGTDSAAWHQPARIEFA